MSFRKKEAEASHDPKRQKIKQHDDEEEDDEDAGSAVEARVGRPAFGDTKQRSRCGAPADLSPNGSGHHGGLEEGYPSREGLSEGDKTLPDKVKNGGSPPSQPIGPGYMRQAMGPTGPGGPYSPTGGQGMVGPYFGPGPGMHGMHMGPGGMGGYGYPSQQQFYGGHGFMPGLGMGGNFMGHGGMGGYGPGYFMGSPGGGYSGGGYPGDPMGPIGPTSAGGSAPSPNAASGNLPSQAQPHDGPDGATSRITGRSPALLYMPCDDDSLSAYQCLVRQQIELFEARELDVDSNAQGRNKPIVLGQVGIRCRHCNMLPPRHRSRASVYYPAKLNGLYQAAQNMANIHLCQHCQHISPGLKAELNNLRTRKSSAGGGKKYWGDGARVKGVYECEDGLRFEQQPQQQQQQPPPSQQH